MHITRGYRAELDLNNQQVTECKKHAGAARWAYNWGLSRKQEVYRTTGRSISAMEVHRELNTLKQTDFPWLYDVSKCAPQEALRDLDSAVKNFFRRVHLKKEGKWRGPVGYPRYKSKKKGLGSFRLTGAIHVFDRAVCCAPNSRLFCLFRKPRERPGSSTSRSDATCRRRRRAMQHTGPAPLY